MPSSSSFYSSVVSLAIVVCLFLCCATLPIFATTSSLNVDNQSSLINNAQNKLIQTMNVLEISSSSHLAVLHSATRSISTLQVNETVVDNENDDDNEDDSIQAIIDNSNNTTITTNNTTIPTDNTTIMPDGTTNTTNTTITPTLPVDNDGDNDDDSDEQVSNNVLPPQQQPELVDIIDILNSTNSNNNNTNPNATIFTTDLFAKPFDIYNPNDKVIPRALQEPLNVERYLGLWYETFSKPLFWSSQCIAMTSDLYTLADDGSSILTNPRCETKNGDISENFGEAFFIMDQNPYNTELKVSFLPFGWLRRWATFAQSDYWILELQDDPILGNQVPYKYSLVGSPDKNYLWLLSREQFPPQDEIKHFLLRAEKVFGYDISNVKLTSQISLAPIRPKFRT